MQVIFSKDKPVFEIKACGCQIIHLAQGCAILPCTGHEPAMMTILQEPKPK